MPLDSSTDGASHLPRGLAIDLAVDPRLVATQDEHLIPSQWTNPSSDPLSTATIAALSGFLQGLQIDSTYHVSTPLAT